MAGIGIHTEPRYCRRACLETIDHLCSRQSQRPPVAQSRRKYEPFATGKHKFQLHLCETSELSGINWAARAPAQRTKSTQRDELWHERSLSHSLPHAGLLAREAHLREMRRRPKALADLRLAPSET